MSDAFRGQLQESFGAGYTIEREVGGGGMSQLLVARDAILDREIVVKVLPPDAAAALSGDRFRREIALAAELQHPHTFRGSFDGGMPHANYAISADGAHVIVLPTRASSSPDAVVTLNWTEELSRKLGRK